MGKKPDKAALLPALTVGMVKDHGRIFCDPFIDSNVTQD
jgi:hypothetical protein